EAVVLPAKGHTVITVPGKEPTCTNSGLSDYVYCDTCKLVFEEQSILPRLGHSYSYEDQGNGMHIGTCTRCSKTTSASHSIGENGSCICGYTSVINDEGIKLNHTLDLASDISVNYAIPVSLLQGYDMDSVKVQVHYCVYEGNTAIGNRIIDLRPELKGSYYYFTLEGITAVQMNDSLYATFYGTKNGTAYCSATDEYSIATYAYSQLNSATRPEVLKRLCADLLRYGSKAQIYKSYRTGSLADAAMTEAHKAYLSDIEAVAFGNTNRVLEDLANAPVTWVGKSLNLESKVALKFIFKSANYAGDPDTLSLRLSYTVATGNSKTVELTEVEVYDQVRGYYAFTLDTLLAAELRSVISAQIYAGDTPVSATLQYSPDTYGNNKTGNLLNLCKALFAYSDSAKAYFA
ncbi:MAG: hypothetical protein IKM59_07015, partial [Oscillospiraceae bacterium]|nr:hypothetical protein [Oscillospiraceae bacterium]